MNTTTVNRRDITLREYDEHTLTGHPSATSWVAFLSGRLSTGEQVDMSRSGPTFREALANLEAAIAEQGWVIE